MAVPRPGAYDIDWISSVISVDIAETATLR